MMIKLGMSYFFLNQSNIELLQKHVFVFFTLKYLPQNINQKQTSLIDIDLTFALTDERKQVFL